MCTVKERFLCACNVYSLSIDKQLATYETDQAIEYLWNLLEYNSSREVYLKFQNGGSGVWQLSQEFLIKTPIMDTLFELKNLE